MLSLTLLMPSVAFENSVSSSSEIKDHKNYNISSVGKRLVENEPNPDLSKETKLKIKELKIQLKNGEITKEQFHQEIKKIVPENYQLKHKKMYLNKYKNLNAEDKVKLQELKLKFENGEITKEEFKEEIKQIISKNNQ